MVLVNIGEHEYSIDDRLKRNLDKIKHRVDKKDADYVFVVDGEEGSGKSVFGMQLGYYLDPTLNLKRICMTANEFIEEVTNANKGECIIYDEAYTGLSSRNVLSEINGLLTSMMMEMRQKNLFVIIILPTFFLLDKYVSLFRAKGLFHVYQKKGKRGHWLFFNKQKKKMLYLKGKKEYSYSGIRSNFYGMFYDKYVIDEQAYRLKKMNALKGKDRTTKINKNQEKFTAQRNKLIWILYKEFDQKLPKLIALCETYQIPLHKTELSEIVLQFKENTTNSVHVRANI